MYKNIEGGAAYNLVTTPTEDKLFLGVASVFFISCNHCDLNDACSFDDEGILEGVDCSMPEGEGCHDVIYKALKRRRRRV